MSKSPSGSSKWVFARAIPERRESLDLTKAEADRVTGKRKGKTMDTKEVLVFKLDKGVVTDVTNFQSNHPAVAQFWS
jgi:hypothetical protein